jgi:Zn-dependent M28 family amino/carboxypeptidase
VIWALVVLLALGLLGIRYVTGMPGRTHRGFLPLQPEARRVRDRLEQHVRVLADEIGERHVWRVDALNRAAGYIEASLSAAGFAVRSQEFVVDTTPVRNIEVELVGHGWPRQVVVVGAHYDSVVDCPGANDNGSGIAALLELARAWVSREPARTLRFVAFVNEEPPFCFTRGMGSWVYARRCRERREHVVGMLSLETIGCYLDHRGSQRYPFPFGLLYPRTGDFIGFVANLSSRRLVRQCVGAFRRSTAFPSQGAAAPGYLPGIFWSDHWSFWREGYRAVMVTDTAPFRYVHYHTSTDTSDRIDYDRMACVVLGLDSVIGALAGSPLPARAPGRGE